MKIKLFGNGDDHEPEMEEEKYVEVNVMQSGNSPGKIGIRIEKLTDFADTERVLRMVREGSVIFLRIKDLKEKDMGELKRSVERLKKAISANNGDIAGIEENWLILAPEFVTVHR